MKKRFRLALVALCMLVLTGIRVFSPEDDRICDGNLLVKHGNPSADGSGFFSFEKKSQDKSFEKKSQDKCSGGKLFVQSLLVVHNNSMKITSDFIDNETIPSMYTCDGEGYFPKLIIEEIPSNTKSLALVVDDPDAPTGTRDHLLLANIPPPEYDNLIISQDTFDLGILGQNSRGELAWGAPCPPSGQHRYIFKLYAFSEVLELSSGFTKERLIELMGGRILAQTQIVGLYTRQ